MVPDGPRDPHPAALSEAEGGLRPAERAYRVLREAILTGALAPGAHLREEPLAAMTGTSRTPVREALRRVVAEGLAREEKGRRFVADFSYEEVVIVFDIRAKLESYAAGIAASRITDAEVTGLEALVEEIDGLARGRAADAVERFLALNSDFHARIFAATRSRQLRLLSAQATALPLVMIKQVLWEQDIDIARSNAQHRDIVAALRRRNPEWAAGAMAAHILSTKPGPRP